MDICYKGIGGNFDYSHCQCDLMTRVVLMFRNKVLFLACVILLHYKLLFFSEKGKNSQKTEIYDETDDRLCLCVCARMHVSTIEWCWWCNGIVWPHTQILYLMEHLANLHKRWVTLLNKMTCRGFTYKVIIVLGFIF